VPYLDFINNIESVCISCIGKIDLHKSIRQTVPIGRSSLKQVLEVCVWVFNSGMTTQHNQSRNAYEQKGSNFDDSNCIRDVKRDSGVENDEKNNKRDAGYCQPFKFPWSWRMTSRGIEILSHDCGHSLALIDWESPGWYHTDAIATTE